LLSFTQFIAQKPLFYKEIDHKRVHRAYQLLKPHIGRPQTVHIIGTNGKGSTGRVMAGLLHHAGLRVGHFSSPHILKFNERIWIEGEDIEDVTLEQHHKRLYSILGEEMSENLTYFEYTTLLALVAMEHLDIIILEAGLGGEFDATNVVKKELTIVTPIGFDHQEFLGNTIEEIATTKLNSIANMALVGFQPYGEVYNLAQGFYLLKDMVEAEVADEVLKLTQKLEWSHYLYENTLLAIYGIKLLNLSYNIQDLKSIKLFGRFYQIAPNVTIDVGHNLLALNAISRELERRYGEKGVVLIYNSLEDKDYNAILRGLKRYIKRVEIIPIKSNRALDVELLQASLKNLSIKFRMFETVNREENYLVFGSFFVVESFIKKIYFKYK
jgi:dihydrofolate synthase/folylpolyglutamate synthase